MMLNELIKYYSCHHIETSQLIIETIQLICRANQLTGFYTMTTLAFNELMTSSLVFKLA